MAGTGRSDDGAALIRTRKYQIVNGPAASRSDFLMSGIFGGTNYLPLRQIMLRFARLPDLSEGSPHEV